MPASLKLVSLRLPAGLLREIEELRTSTPVPPGKRDYFQWLLIQGILDVKARRKANG